MGLYFSNPDDQPVFCLAPLCGQPPEAVHGLLCKSHRNLAGEFNSTRGKPSFYKPDIEIQNAWGEDLKHLEFGWRKTDHCKNCGEVEIFLQNRDKQFHWEPRGITLSETLSEAREAPLINYRRLAVEKQKAKARSGT